MTDKSRAGGTQCVTTALPPDNTNWRAAGYQAMIDGLMPHQGPCYLTGGREHREYVEGWHAAYAEYQRQGETREEREAWRRERISPYG